MLRTLGQWMTKIRRMAGEFQSQFQEAMREAEMADLKKQVDELSDSRQGHHHRSLRLFREFDRNGSAKTDTPAARRGE